MFVKIFKQEFRETAKLIGFGLGLAIVLDVMSLFMILSPYTALQITGNIMGVMVPFALLISIFFYLANRYWKTMYGQRAYFTHALPVNSAVILRAKFLWFYLVHLLAAVVSVIGFTFFSLASVSSYRGLSGWINSAGVVVRPEPSIWVKMGDLCALFAQTIANLDLIKIAAIAALILGCELLAVVWVLASSALANHRIFSRLSENWALAISIVSTYLVYQTVTVVSIFAIPLHLVLRETADGRWSSTQFVAGGIMDVVTREGNSEVISKAEFSSSSYSVIPLGMFLVIVLLLLLGYWISHQMLKKQLNLR
ncbi:hypothetical protein RQN30_08885 [Arcanobacterium hippocoleae]